MAAVIIPLNGRSSMMEKKDSMKVREIPAVTQSTIDFSATTPRASMARSTTTPRSMASMRSADTPRTMRSEVTERQHAAGYSARRAVAVKKEWDGKSHVKPLAASLRKQEAPQTAEDMKRLVQRCLKRGERTLVDEAVGDDKSPAWPAPRRKRGPERLFAPYDLQTKGTISRRDCREILRSVGVALTDDDLSRVVDSVTNDRTGRVDYASLLAPEDRPQARIENKKMQARRALQGAAEDLEAEPGSYAAQYAAEKNKQLAKAEIIESRLCASMTDPNNVATLRRKLQQADGPKAGVLAPCDFARAIRDYAGEPLDNDDEIALCDAYDHRKLRLLDEGAGGLSVPVALKNINNNNPETKNNDNDDDGRSHVFQKTTTGEVVSPLVSPRRSRLAREEDEGARAFVERRLFCKRKGQGSLWQRQSKSDESVRAALWRAGDSMVDDAIVRCSLEEKTKSGALERQRPVGFRPVLGREHFEANYDAVDYEKFLENLERRADADSLTREGSYAVPTRRRAIRKIASALATNEQRDKWDRAFCDSKKTQNSSKTVHFEEPLEEKDAIATLATLGINLSTREAAETLALAKKNNNNIFDARFLKTNALRAADALDDFEDRQKDQAYDLARQRGEARRRGGAAGLVRPQTASLLRDAKTPVSSSSGAATKKDDGHRPLLLRSRFDDDEFVTRRARTFDDAIVPRAAGRPTRTSSRSKHNNRRMAQSVDASKRHNNSNKGSTLAAYLQDDNDVLLAPSRYDRVERLTLARAMASVSNRAKSDDTLGAALATARKPEALDAGDLTHALRRIGAPVNAIDAARIVAAAAEPGASTASTTEIRALLRKYASNDDHTKKPSRGDQQQRRQPTKTNVKDSADAVVSLVATTFFMKT